MINWIKRIFCRHPERTHLRNIYGDEIIEWGWKRSLWKCNKCGAIIAGDHLHQPEDRP